MYCNHCGKVIQDDANLCAYCGHRVGTSMARLRLVRPRVGRKIGGVALGMAEYFALDPTIVRLFWVALGLCCPPALLAYLIAWIVIPEQPEMWPAAPPVGAQTSTPAA